MRFLIDASGEEWNIDEPWIHRYLAFHGTAQELIRLTVGSLGYAYVQTDGDRMTIRLRPDYISKALFERLVMKLGWLEPRRIIIQLDVASSESVDILTDASDAIARLHEFRMNNSGRSGPKFFADELSLDRLKLNPASSLSAVYRRWCRTRGRLSAHELRRLFDDPLRAPWFIGSVDRDGSLVARTLPEYITFWGNTDRASLIGAPMVNHPDKDFGAAAEKSYLAVHREERPAMDLVNMVVRPVSGPLHWSRYHRLVLPWRTTDGSVLLSSLTAIKVARDLTPAVAA